MTAWTLPQDMDRRLQPHMADGKAYPSSTQCGKPNGKARVRMDTVAFHGAPPFHRGQWHLTRNDTLQTAIAKIRLNSRPDLKFRVALSMSANMDGINMTCAIVCR